MLVGSRVASRKYAYVCSVEVRSVPVKDSLKVVPPKPFCKVPVTGIRKSFGRYQAPVTVLYGDTPSGLVTYTL